MDIPSVHGLLPRFMDRRFHLLSTLIDIYITYWPPFTLNFHTDPASVALIWTLLTKPLDPLLLLSLEDLFLGGVLIDIEHEVKGVTGLIVNSINWDHDTVCWRIICRAGRGINIIIVHPEDSD